VVSVALPAVSGKKSPKNSFFASLDSLLRVILSIVSGDYLTDNMGTSQLQGGISTTRVIVRLDTQIFSRNGWQSYAQPPF
jgi:hypothetical protein